ncbi:hypothetical protein CKM354_000240400 [Cercospora kikuchii]|uniref:Uncharacterized protein n=1 Tax=Cercospora kikuchii TaxID=84275 RepID=A0A9P3C984_9PEZI|nr:uncharacterized protein CKM354_000240400 [Cercospora kikuchii]GIZ39012.1 hypothetical protein CKM354_000240400 [Cercospora kikuchii]
MIQFSNWMALLLATLLVQHFPVRALPNPESSLDQRSLGGAAVPLALFSRERKAIDGLIPTDLVNRAPAEPPASNVVAGKHSTTHTTSREHPVDGKVPAPNQQNAIAKGRPPQTHLTALEAAKGGTVIKSGSDKLEPAKPAAKGLGESKIGLADPPHGRVPADEPCNKFPMQTDVQFVGTVYYNLVKGFKHQLSEPECPPGSIGHTYSFSTSWSISGQIGPDMKATLPGLTPFKKYLDKLGARVGVAYTWTNTQSTTYTGSETGGQSHPFVLTYQPLILVVTGDIQVLCSPAPLKLFLFVFCTLFARGMESTSSAKDV